MYVIHQPYYIKNIRFFILVCTYVKYVFQFLIKHQDRALFCSMVKLKKKKFFEKPDVVSK